MLRAVQWGLLASLTTCGPTSGFQCSSSPTVPSRWTCSSTSTDSLSGGIWDARLVSSVTGRDATIPHWLSLGEVLGVINRGSQSINNLLSYVLFNILPTLADIAVAVVYFVVAFDGWFGLIVFTTMISYIYFSIYTTEWRTKYRRYPSAWGCWGCQDFGLGKNCTLAHTGNFLHYHTHSSPLSDLMTTPTLHLWTFLGTCLTLFSQLYFSPLQC